MLSSCDLGLTKRHCLQPCSEHWAVISVGIPRSDDVLVPLCADAVRTPYFICSALTSLPKVPDQSKDTNLLFWLMGTCWEREGTRTSRVLIWQSSLSRVDLPELKDKSWCRKWELLQPSTPSASGAFLRRHSTISAVSQLEQEQRCASPPEGLAGLSGAHVTLCTWKKAGWNDGQPVLC